MKDICEIKEWIRQADYILIGAGSGLSTAAGIEYSGKRFENTFMDFIQKYHFTDMYTSSFYEFETEEEKWAYWAKHIDLNCTGMSGTKLYEELFQLIKEKEYFVLTTNVDRQFIKSGFDKDKVFEIQGSYQYIQCKEACHNQLYDDQEIVHEMLDQIIDCKIPTKLVPKCPVCGGKMDVNLRKDANFVQDKRWYQQNERYEQYLNKMKDKKLLLLELGVGFNTPGIIRIPFEQMTFQNEKWKLARVNKENIQTTPMLQERYIGIRSDIDIVVEELNEK